MAPREREKNGPEKRNGKYVCFGTCMVVLMLREPKPDGLFMDFPLSGTIPLHRFSFPHAIRVLVCVCVYTAAFTFLRLSNNLASTRTRAPPARICSSGGVCLKKIPKLQVNTQRNFVAPRMLCNTVSGLTDHFALPFAYFTAHSYIGPR